MFHQINPQTEFQPPPGCSKGAVKRDFQSYPLGFYSAIPVFSRRLMTDDEIEASIIKKNADGSWLDDVWLRGDNGKPIKNRFQNGVGYCWNHSVTSAACVIRAKANMPFADLSAFAIGCMIKNFRDQGGWNQEAVQFAAERGIPTSEYWPQRSMSRANDNPRTWENAALHKWVTWEDMPSRDKRALATGLCNDDAVASDFNWWGHSVLTVRLLAWGPNGRNMKTRIVNSWGDDWGTGGLGDLEGDHAIPDNMTACRDMTASVT